MRSPVNELPLEMQVGEIETRGVDWGDQLVRHIDLPAGTDFTPLFVGLPGNMCQCPHWGYVLSGRLAFRYAGGEEVFEAGDAFYTPPGHAPVVREAGTEFVMFSPADELKVTEDVMMRNMAAMQAG